MKKIRLRFFLIAAASLFVVLFSIMVGLNVSNYVNIKNESYNTCNIILNSTNGEPLGPEQRDPEIIFKSRYFISYYIEDELVSIDTSRIVRINPNEAINMSNDIHSGSSLNGFSGIYYYIKSNEMSFERIIFLDRQAELDSFYNVLKASSIIAASGYVVVLILIYLLSSFVIKPIEEANKKQKRFITDASHELKTPLTIINSNVSLIEMENGESEWTESIKKQTDRLTNMTNELVLLSKLNEDDLKLNKEPIELDSFLSEIAQPYYKILLSKKVILILDLAPDLNVNGDILLLSKLFYALFDNMCKYAYEGDAKVIAKKVKNSAELCFVNKIEPGSSIDVISIFDRFYKEDESRSSKPNSFGVGLSMAKAIVDLHKGKISANLENENIIFKIIL